MAKANEKEKSFTILEKDLHVISAVNNQKLSPYLDVFRHYPENVLMQNLGILTGFFKINDLSEESAYIVNFLSSVLKKEYYANSKRSIESSFDSALRKVNLALSEIAKEGNVNWLGKIDGCVCILEKNNLHFSVCGRAKVLLFRSQTLTEISIDMAPEDIEPNPIKTFINVSSGRLEKEDKLIISEDDIFEVFSEEEIRKGANRFQREKFIQFLKTALTNRLEIVGTIIVDIFEKEEKKAIAHQMETEIQNVFSKKLFEKKKETPKDLSEILKEDESGYTDEKTGHIYIQEDKEEELKKESSAGIYWLIFKEKLGDSFFWIKNRSKRKIIFAGRSIAKNTGNLISDLKLKLEEGKRLRAEKSAAKALAEEEKKAALASAAASSDAKALEDKKALADEEEKEAAIAKSKIEDLADNAPLPELEVKAEPMPEFEEPFLQRLARRKAELERQEALKQEKTEKTGISLKEKLLSARKLIPDFGRIKGLFLSLSKKEKLYSLVIVLLILIVPLVFLKLQGIIKSKNAPQAAEQKIPDEREILSEEKNIVFLDNPENLFQIQDPKKIMVLNDKIIALSNGKIATKNPGEEVREISWPSSYGEIAQSAPMKDLNLALVYTNQNKMISFLSATSQFKENNISIPDGSKITGLGTYLTYAYLLDSKNNQIYRYPRAEGGFGDKIDWLKDSINLENACCLAIDENVYLTNGNEIMKIFKGKKQDLTLEPAINTFTPDEIFTDSDTNNLYLLDAEKGRIMKYSKDGALLGQYFHESIKNSTGFTIDEKNNKAYTINSQGALSWNLQ